MQVSLSNVFEHEPEMLSFCRFAIERVFSSINFLLGSDSAKAII